MGYTVELWATPPGAVLAALASPGAAPAAGSVPDRIADTWPDLARAVEGAVRDGGARLFAEHAQVVAAAIREAGHHYGSLEHTSSGGDEFRRRFLSGPAAARYGRDSVTNLLTRGVGGLHAEEYPRFGHLTAAEVAAIAGRLADPPDLSEHPEDATALSVLDGALRRAARFGMELHAIYG